MGDTIVSVQFGISNPDDILKRSVVEVTTEKTHQSGQPVPNGVFDARFGVIENGKVCPTCKQTNQHCPGHFGHIRLARPVYLYQFFDMIEKVCNVICLSCSKILVPDEVLQTITSKGLARFKDIKSEVKKTTCPHCNTQPFEKVVKVAERAASLEGIYKAKKDAAAIPPIPLQPELILRAFQHMTDEDIDNLGFNHTFSRPEWMICTVLAVPPLTVRPSVMMDDHGRMEDDLTHKLIDILRHNDKLREMIEKGQNADIIDKYTATLQYHVATYVDNDIKGMPASQQRSGRPLRTLKSRFGSKTGRVRGNLMGKRVDFSARSVITPDANIDLDELGVPEEIATNLTFPETVSAFNRERLLGYIRNGPDKHPGAKSVHIKRDDKTVSLRYLTSDSIDLHEGDIVHRHLIDGDIVLFNRQPSLHKASMEAHRVRVLPYSTFRLNVSATKPYNADFDGDEMNMHVPQSISAATELRQIASVLNQIISPRTASPIIAVFQDTMTGVYRMSTMDIEIPEHIAMNMLAKINRTSIPRKNRPWTGREIISMAFPLMTLKTNLTIENGQLVKGVLKKSAFTNVDDSSNGLVHVVFTDYSPQRCGQMINDIQAIVAQYNLYTGFSVGTSDLIANLDTLQEVNKNVANGRDKVAKILHDVHAGKFINNTGFTNGERIEQEITAALNAIAQAVNESVDKSLPPDNRIVQMVSSGSKGNKQNITQMVALLGQQLIEGKRVQYTLQDRTLPHFARYDDGVESRGFIQHSFIDGLMPAEFFYHAQAGREGLIDTAVKTSDTGYIQRRLMKTMEDQHVEYDNTIRNASSTIVQFRYGEDGIDTTCLQLQPFNLTLMTMEQIYTAFALTPDELAPFVKGDVGEINDLVDEILIDRDMFVKNVFRYKSTQSIYAPVHFDILISKYANPYATQTDLTPGYVVAGIGRFAKEFPENKVFHALLRFNIAPKKSILLHRFTVALFDELMRDIRHRYIKARCHPGEMIGALAAQSIGEPTTQLTLNTFHSTGTAKANATAGVPRINELIEARKTPKRPGNTIYLLPELSSDQNEAIKKMKEIQKTTLRDITKSVRIFYDPNPSSQGTVIDEDRELLALYEQFSIGKPECEISKLIMRIELDTMEQVRRNMLDLTLIQAKINSNTAIKNFVSCEHSDASGKKAILRITFTAATNPVLMRYMEDKVLDTVLSGVEGIGRVHLREVKGEVIYNPLVGGYAQKPQYVLDTEGTNLYDLAVFPGVDGTRTFTNDINEALEVFGIETARLALYEEFNEVFASEKVNYHHLSVLIDSMTFSGRIVAISRSGMKKNETGVFAKASFEETSQTMFNAAIEAESDTMMGVSANIMFGQKPPCGTGFVDILVDEARLPEGSEEIENDTGLIDEVNTKLAVKEDTECRMEDILMEW